MGKLKQEQEPQTWTDRQQSALFPTGATLPSRDRWRPERPTMSNQRSGEEAGDIWLYSEIVLQGWPLMGKGQVRKGDLWPMGKVSSG